MAENPNMRRNIVLSYIRDGLPEGEAVRAADKLIRELESRRRPTPPKETPE